MLTVGVIGCGKASESHHFPAIESVNDIELTWVCDLDEQRAARAAKKYGVPAYTDTADALSDTPDLVNVNTPPSTHREVTIQALEAGGHVLVEKPIAHTKEDARAIISAAEESDQKVCLVHNNLYFDPLYAVLRSNRRGEYGDIVAINSLLGGRPNEEEKRSWAKSLKGGPILDRLPHPIYLVTHFMDEIEERSITIYDDEGSVHGVGIQLTDGVRTGSIQVMETALPAKSVHIVGTRKRAYIDLFNYSKLEYDNFDRSPLTMLTDNLGGAAQLTAGTARAGFDFVNEFVSSGNKFAGPGHYNLLKEYKWAIQNDQDPPIPVDSGIETVNILQEIEGKIK